MELFQELYLKNIPIEEIVKQTGISKPSLYRRLKKLGVVRKYGESHKGKKLTEEHKNNIKLALSKTDVKGRPPTMINNKGMTDDLAYILGVMYGDGYIVSKSGIGLQVKDEDFADCFEKTMERQFNLKSKKYISNGRVLHDWRNNKEYNTQKTFIIRVSSVILRDYIIRIKNFETIKSFNNTQKISFLRGLWDSEGSISISSSVSRISFTHNSKELCILFQSLLIQTTGINAKFYQTTQGNHILYIQHRDNIKRFYEVINPTIKRKRLVFEEIIKSLK